MPTIQSTTSIRATALSAAPLTKGKAAADLQRALSFLQLDISEREVKAERFGTSTRAALKAFQTREHLPVTGLLDDATARRLDSVLATRGFFPAKHRPFQDRQLLRVAVSDDDRLAGDAGDFVRQRLNGELKDAILRELKNPSDALRSAVRGMDLDYAAVAGETLSSVLNDRVLPALLDRPELEEELERHADRGFSAGGPTVGARLMLNTDLLHHPLFREEARRSRNAALAAIASLDARTTEAIEDLDLDTASKETWDRLVEDRVLTARTRRDLENAVDFAKLSDDRFELIEALHRDRRMAARDLISMDESDWRTLLTRQRIAPPPGDTLDTYAKVLDRSVQQALRTPYTMQRLVERNRNDVLRRVGDLEPVRTRNERIFVDGAVNDALDWTGVGDSERARIEASLDELNRFANTYRHLGIAEILDDGSLDTRAKETAIRARRDLLLSFHRNNADLDLAWADFFDGGTTIGRAFQVNWTGIAGDDRRRVRRTMMALQRAQRLTDDYAETEVLLAAGLDSGIAILALTEAQLARRTGLSRSAAERIHRKAGESALLTGHALNLVEELTTHAPLLPAVLKEAAGGPNLDLVNVLRDIDGYQDLFGDQNYCRCKHCRSIFGPAAYFVDLMDFIGRHVSDPAFVEPDRTDHPLYLGNRRSDLWTLVLSCRNTDTKVPYLSIVNEVLEAYLQRIFEDDDIYEALTAARVSFNQPFNLPFQALLLHLRHFQVALADVYALFALPAADIARARLRFAPQELQTIVSANLDDVLLRYDIPSGATALRVADIVKRSGYTREELGRLLELDFVRGALFPTFRSESATGDLIGFDETLSIRTAANGASLSSDHALVRHFLDRLHRFRRLGRRLPWTIEEQHLVLVSLIDPAVLADVAAANTVARTAALGQALNDAVVIDIANLRAIQDAFAVTVEELLALNHEIPRSPLSADKASMFVRLFGEVDSLRIEHPVLGNAQAQPASVSSDFGLLQGALRLSEAQILELVPIVLAPQVIAGAVLGHEHLSALYRHAALARYMRLGPGALARLQDLLALPRTAPSPAERIAHILALLDFRQALDETPFSIDDVLWLVTGEISGAAGPRMTGPQIDAILERMRSDPLLFLTPSSLLEIEGMSLTQAQALVAVLAREPFNWLLRSDEAEERYRITQSLGLAPDVAPVAAFFADAGDAPDVAARKAAEVRQQLSRHHPHTLLIGRLIEQFNITEAYFEALRPFLSADPADESFIASLFGWLAPGNALDTQPMLTLMQTVERSLHVVREKLDLPVRSLDFIAASPGVFSLALPFGLTWPGLRLLGRYREFLPSTEEEQASLHQALAGWTGQQFAEASLSFLATLLKTDAVQLQSLSTHLAFGPAALDALAGLAKALKVTSTLGLNGAALRQLTASDYAGLRAADALVEGAIRAKYEHETQWAEVIEPYVDELNEIKRDALVDRILSRAFQLHFDDARELYQFFLLDVEMDGCARTSRVLEAISACQLYVHRCRMNLEQAESGDVHVPPDSIPADEWLWRRNYRVWQANREVFAYPERWLVPDLRDDKTPLFKQVESDLLQSTIAPAAIEKIYRDYLREYAEIAKLVVVSALYDDNEDAYLFFARSRDKPYRYYWRRLVRNKEWHAWEKIELEIEPGVVSAHKHRGRLYLFWVRVLTNNDKDQEQADTTSIEDNQTVYLEYAFVESDGRWSAPGRLPFHNITVLDLDNPAAEFDAIPQAAVNSDGAAQIPVVAKARIAVARHYDKVYAHTAPDDPRIRVFHRYADERLRSAHLNEYAHRLDRQTLLWTPNVPFIPFYAWTDVLKVYEDGNFPLAALVVSEEPEASPSGEVDYEDALHRITQLPLVVTNLFSSHLRPSARIVHNRTGDTLLAIDDQQFFVRYIGGEGYRRDIGSLFEAAIAFANRKREMMRLSTTLADTLGEVLFDQGLERFLSLDTQRLLEAPIHGVDFTWIAELPPPMDTGTQGHLDFDGAQGPYYRELFLHLPFLIAHYLNASRKFADADYWYRRIFDPTASENPEPANRTDRNWRYLEFRNRNVPRLRQILTDENAIARYREDPFNPFAIARLRILAFQKAVVMKYVDNLLDWGDELFGQDTAESINEATLLYIMAADVLGDRPAEVGDCDTTAESLLTYRNILSHQVAGSEFLIELENLQTTLAHLNLEALDLHFGGEGGGGTAPANGFALLRERNVGFKPYQSVKATMMQASPPLPALPAQFKVAAKAATDAAVHRTLAFCVPFNDELLGYWDRVADRLFKIRNCMNLAGVRRELALFAPPIDPGLLVKAKAAGLSLEDVLGLLTAEVPAYRFTYLLEKAKQFAGTVQSFGSAFLSALEKKDTEELTLLRAVHEQELLKALRKVKEDAVLESAHADAVLTAGKASASARATYYTDLLATAADPALALSKNEQESLNKQEDAKGNEDKSSKREQGASGINAAPYIGFSFRPLEIKVPFHPFAEVPIKSEIGTLRICYSTENVASALSASAAKFRTESSFKSIESARAAVRGGHERRKQEWEHQKNLAKLEEAQVDKQLLASGVRIAMAQKDLDAHKRQIEQSVELHAFHKDKFTDLGLYTYLATSLSRLYRDAYNVAHDLAMKAQRAYQYETDDQTFFVGSDNWQADRAGLLSGERLTLQLERMDKAYLEQTRREYEITLPCSLMQIDPQALIDLRETGRCDFSVAEIWFDLFYPGQYRRRIKSVRLTVPCVTGPYTNVSAKLTLTGSRIRSEPRLTSEPIAVAHQRNTSVASSSANNDAGVFELDFRDARYAPFEGAGAISDWRLELPSVFRPFNYDTISDVILHIGYVARDDGRFREDVEGDLAARFEQLAAEAGLVRWFSMKHEFGSAFHRLQRPSEEAAPSVEITLDRRHFPHFLRDRDITLEQATLILKPVQGDALVVDDLDLRLDNAEGGEWLSFPSPEGLLRARTFALGQALAPTGNQWTVAIEHGTLAHVDDIWIVLVYAI